jgi:hypothetical protein
MIDNPEKPFTKSNIGFPLAVAVAMNDMISSTIHTIIDLEKSHNTLVDALNIAKENEEMLRVRANQAEERSEKFRDDLNATTIKLKFVTSEFAEYRSRKKKK